MRLTGHPIFGFSQVIERTHLTHQIETVFLTADVQFSALPSAHKQAWAAAAVLEFRKGYR